MSSSLQCSSCGQVFRYASFEPGGNCGKCMQPESESRQCMGCSKLFLRLTGTECGMCSQTHGTLIDARTLPTSSQPVISIAKEAVTRPFNPRSTPTAASQRFAPGNLAAASALSQSIVNRMNAAYRDAAASHLQYGGDPPTPTGLPSTHATVLVPNVFVKVPNLFLITKKALRKQPSFTPFHVHCAGNMMFLELKEEIRKCVDAHCSSKVDPPFRVYSSDEFELLFIGTDLPPIHETRSENISTLYAIHKAKKDYYITPKTPKDVLCFNIRVVMPIPSTDRFSEFRSIGVKHRASTEFLTRFKSRTTSSHDRTPSDLVTYKKLFSTTLRLELEAGDHDDPDNDSSEGSNGPDPLDFREEASEIKAEYRFFERVIIGRGATKKAIKIQNIEGEMKFYAAKYYTKVDNSRQVSEIGNIEHCKDEMKRAHTAAYIAEAFTQEAKDRKVAIHALRFLQPFILHEKSPLADGPAWLCDEFIAGNACKYSGTSNAGTHETNFAGRTCDALAHYSLSSSEGARVLVDLQGIITTNAQGSGGLPILSLYDVQIHNESEDNYSGLGDDGIQGIETFREQHKCNDICTGLGLVSFS